MTSLHNNNSIKNGSSHPSQMNDFIKKVSQLNIKEKTYRVHEKPIKKPIEADVNDKSDDDWAIDPRTGKKYRVLPSAPKEAIKAFSKNNRKGLSLSQLRQFTEDVEDFDADDLTSTAESFLAHLRVAPDKDEIERLRAERSERMKKQSAEFTDQQQKLDKKFGSDDPNNPEAFKF